MGKPSKEATAPTVLHELLWRLGNGGVAVTETERKLLRVLSLSANKHDGTECPVCFLRRMLGRTCRG